MKWGPLTFLIDGLSLCAAPCVTVVGGPPLPALNRWELRLLSSYHSASLLVEPPLAGAPRAARAL